MGENEEWLEVEDLPHYLVSSFGQVRRYDSDEPRTLFINDRGFPAVVLYGQDSKTRYNRQVNKLVATAFLRPPIEPFFNAVWHIDGNPLNCFYGNLKWATKKEVLEWNQMHRKKSPQYNTPPVKNNRTGDTYANAFECAMAENLTESSIVYRIERQARHMHDDAARYRYI